MSGTVGLGLGRTCKIEGIYLTAIILLFRHFRKFFQVLGIFSVYLLLGKIWNLLWQNLEPTLANFVYFWANFL